MIIGLNQSVHAYRHCTPEEAVGWLEAPLKSFCQKLDNKEFRDNPLEDDSNPFKTHFVIKMYGWSNGSDRMKAKETTRSSDFTRSK